MAESTHQHSSAKSLFANPIRNPSRDHNAPVCLRQLYICCSQIKKAKTAMSSRTWTARTSLLNSDQQLASVIVRLMMVQNDISMANEGLSEWTDASEQKKLARQYGGKLYYGRMLMSHVFEALEIIEEIQNSAHLHQAVQKSDPGTRASFNSVAAFLKSPAYFKLLRIRNNVGFHYPSKLAVKALEQIDKKFPGHRFCYSLGQQTLDWYFELGDLLLDRIVVRDIFKAPEGADVRAAIDPILLRLHAMAVAFSDFAGYFIRHSLKR
jgi:hypothetical protein